MTQPRIIDWHRAFGIAIKNLISEYGYSVETEIEVSKQKQLLDLIIIRQDQQPIDKTKLETLCDGFDNLTKYNLISYKSLHESFNDFAAEELYSYYISYRKLTEQKATKLTKADYQLYGISTRQPEKLLQAVNHKQIKPGVYDLNTGLKPIRLLVLSALEQKESNAILHLFSNKTEKLKYGYEHLDKTTFNANYLPVIDKILKLYKLEGLPMPYTEEQFLADCRRDMLSNMTPQERLQGLRPQERLEGLRPEEIKEYLDSLQNKL